jgi:hypothetical protein
MGAVRLAKTPSLDGKLEPEEWERFSLDGAPEASFQWEPETIYWSCRVEPGQDAVLSLDQGADGWLVGSDNLEIRVSPSATEPGVRARVLDASNPGNPQWRTGLIPADMVKIAVAPADQGGFIVEASYMPVFGKGPEPGRQLGVRLDSVASGKEIGEPFVPRGLATVFLQMDSSENIPMGVSWRPVITNRSVSLMDRLRLSFGLTREEGQYAPTRVECRGEGAARDVLASIIQPTVLFDNKGRMDVAFESSIAPNANVGWRVVRATFRDAAGEEFTVRSSVRLANLVDIELGFPREARASNDAQIIRGHVTLRSQFSGRVQGVFSMTVPSEWTVTKGKDQTFLIYHTRGTARVPVEFIIPRGQSGTFPLSFRAMIGGQTVERRVFFALEP